MRFLLIEDNHDLGASVQRRLALDGHAVDWARSLSDADDHLSAAGYDLILLDITLPDGDGRDFLARHRRSRADTPVIVLTARAAVSDRVALLDIGADDYITKPFDFAEFEARCRAWPLVRECHMLNGEVDFILKCVAPDLSTFQRFLTEELTAADNVGSVKTSLVIRGAKDEPGVPFDVLEDRLKKSA